MGKDILYGIVVENSGGGQTLDTYVKRESALDRAEEIIRHIKSNNIEGRRVYLSELEYDRARNVLTESSLIKKDSKLLYEH